MTISTVQLVAAVIALAASAVSGILRKDGLPEWANAAFSGAFMLLAAVASVIVAGTFTGNIPADVGLLSGEIALLMAGPLKPLEAFLQVKINAAPKSAPPSPPTSGGSKPQLSVVPPRSSSVTQAAGWQPTATAWNTTPDQSG